MPKVIGHTPSWLSHPSPGARIFSDPEAASPASPSKRSSVAKSSDESKKAATATSAHRTIAHRGTEVFAVVGNKIRWADLAQVKDEWEGDSLKDASRRQQGRDENQEKAYRTLKTPVYYQITNLSVSPSGHFLAISTEHTVHVALLPDPSRLYDGDYSEIKLKTHQLGPTTHVIPEAALASAIWHPLSASSPSADCLITVTTEAAVRVWEFERANQWSFERPALAIDLRKLADGTSSDQDFEPSGFGKNRGFSVDAFDMEAAAACFGGRGSENEDPWAATTLWITMTNGDVYALCPLLPSKSRPASTTIPALTTSAVSRMATIPGEEVDPDERRAADQRFEWVQELDNEALGAGDTVDDSICLRPSNPSAIPRLQGPFELPIDDISVEGDVSDIFVIPANLDEDELYSGEEDYEILTGAKSLPFTVICLATTSSQLHVMIELDGVTGQWLPKKGRSHFTVPTWDAGEFILIDSLLLVQDLDLTSGYPAFTADPSTPYHFFVTTASSIQSISLEDWAARVAMEVSDDVADDVDAGLSGRLRLACQGSICVRKDIVPHQADSSSTLPAAAFIDDLSLGSFLVSFSNGRAVAAQLDQPTLRTSRMLTEDRFHPTSSMSPFRASQSLMQIIHMDSNTANDTPIVRAPYEPSEALYQNQMVFVDRLRSAIPQHRRSTLSEKPLRLSPACLDVMALAHRAFSHQTSVIEKAAAEIFRRCERLREELADQVKQMTELALRLNRLESGSDDGEEGEESQLKLSANHEEKVSTRIESAKARQKELFKRYERVRRKAGQVEHAKQDLSIKEKSWIEEVDSLSKHAGIESDTTSQGRGYNVGQDDTLAQRLDAAMSLNTELLSEAKRIQQQLGTDGQAADSEQQTPDGRLRSRLAGGGNMSRFQKDKIREIMDMVEREAAIIEAVQGRLGKLSVR